MYKIIILGTHCSGKTTLAKYLHRKTHLKVYELDEELTKLNNGNYPEDETYREKVLRPQIEDKILRLELVIYLASYFPKNKLIKAKKLGFKVYELMICLETFRARNKKRISDEQYSDITKWYKKYENYRKEILDLLDGFIDANRDTKMVAREIIDFVQ